MKSVLFVLVLSVIIPLCSYSQVVQQWAQRYTGALDSNDMGVSLACDNQGNVYVLASSQGSMARTDFAVIKYNSAGAQQWVQRYNSPSNSFDQPVKLALDAAGNIYITGYSHVSGFNYDFTTIKYNNSGAQQWVKTYNGTASGDDRPVGMAVDAAGNVYLTGYTASTGSSVDYATIKYSTSGTEEWVKKYNGPANGEDDPSGIILDNTGNICVTGYGPGTGTGFDFATIKYSPTGTELWVKRFTGTGTNNELARGIAADGSGNIYVTGSGTVSFNMDFLTVKYNSTGDTVWTRKYNGPDSDTDVGQYVVAHDENNIYVTGLSYGSGSSEDIATVKYNSSGVQQWAIRYDGPGGSPIGDDPRGLQEESVLGMTLDGAGNIYICGIAYFDDSLHNYATFKYTPSGIQEWGKFYNGPISREDGAFSVMVDNTGNVFVTGYSEHSQSNNYDCITIKYSQPIGIHNISSEIPAGFSLSQNYPNPFNPVTNIQFTIPKPTFVKLVVFDMLGREVVTLVNDELNAGTYNVDMNASELSSGVYFYRIETESFSETKKMLLNK
jgi:uncharacterized delta-60 repeat protein